MYLKKKIWLLFLAANFNFYFKTPAAISNCHTKLRSLPSVNLFSSEYSDFIYFFNQKHLRKVFLAHPFWSFYFSTSVRSDRNLWHVVRFWRDDVTTYLFFSLCVNRNRGSRNYKLTWLSDIMPRITALH